MSENTLHFSIARSRSCTQHGIRICFVSVMSCSRLSNSLALRSQVPKCNKSAFSTHRKKINTNLPSTKTTCLHSLGKVVHIQEKTKGQWGINCLAQHWRKQRGGKNNNKRTKHLRSRKRMSQGPEVQIIWQQAESTVHCHRSLHSPIIHKVLLHSNGVNRATCNRSFTVVQDKPIHASL